NASSTHQKQPPAKMAVAVPSAGRSCAVAEAASMAASSSPIARIALTWHPLRRFASELRSVQHSRLSCETLVVSRRPCIIRPDTATLQADRREANGQHARTLRQPVPRDPAEGFGPEGARAGEGPVAAIS